ncbi:MAG TPA: 5'-methylthioadenosine/S-adenosylhomocysteine nucleosidase, partial [Geobacteraceae bacterium]|nr:5'-methylthioadenosine/S-adenosylhomocysteine nucleosidase [Geobacteraceae bacterium]
MERRVIGLIAAMPEEIKPLLRRIGAYAGEKCDGFEAWRFTLGGCEILLVRSGMGPKNAASATRSLIAAARPELIINFGFAGAVTAGTGVGDIVVADRILLYRERLFPEQPGIFAEKAEEVAGLLNRSLGGKEMQILRGTFVTAAGIKNKREMAELLPAWATNPVLEMETAAVAQAAYEGNVPLIAIRAVSDGAEEDLEFAIEEFTDRELNIRVGEVLLTVAKKPWIVPQLLRLAKNSRIAGDNLAAVLT